MRTLRPGATAVLFGGTPKGAPFSVDSSAMHYEEYTLKGVFHHTPNYVRTAVELLSSRKVDGSMLVTERRPLDAVGAEPGGHGGRPRFEVHPRAMSLRLESERRQVVDACLSLSRSGLVVGTAGNVSIRVDDLVVISPSGVDYEAMSPRDVGIHDLDGRPVDAVLQPSSELALHLAVYRDVEPHRRRAHPRPGVDRAVDRRRRSACVALLLGALRRRGPGGAVRHVRHRRSWPTT